jgi:hypothetical protein
MFSLGIVHIVDDDTFVRESLGDLLRSFCDRADGNAGVGQRPWIRLVLKWAVAIELEFSENAIGRRCGRRRFVSVVVFGRHCRFPSSDWPRQSRPSRRRKAASGPVLHPKRSGGPKRSEGWRSPGYFASRCKAPKSMPIVATGLIIGGGGK